MLDTSVRIILFSLCKLAVDSNVSFPTENANYFQAPTNFNETDFNFDVTNGTNHNSSDDSLANVDANGTSINSNNTPISSIYLDPIFLEAYGKIYPQVFLSGYDSTIYPFEISPESPDITTQPEYEIRFGGDEDLVFPIITSYIDDVSNSLVLVVARPDDYSLQDNITVISRQSFLIRRWIPRAGYIYLDVAADLGSGIVKPEYITDNIKNKIPQIVKELTDKGLI
jgi:hypothetical protein